ncbi:hypothetical protein QUF76_14545 [Desulfobacterales bacterium HSG16]|nr:hypothetical protein [Desulfobacterales bacterium HSG16]
MSESGFSGLKDFQDSENSDSGIIMSRRNYLIFMAFCLELGLWGIFGMDRRRAELSAFSIVRIDGRSKSC